MLTASLFVAIASLAPGGVSSELRNTVDLALRQQLLTSGQTRTEIEQFVCKRAPACTAPASAADWTRDADALRRAVLEGVVYRGAPAEWREGSARIEWVGAIETGKGYRIRKLRYEAIPGFWIPALVYEPTGRTGKLPCVFNVNGHELLEGKAKAYEQMRSINLAKRGILSLHPEWINCGELRVDALDHNASAYLDLCGVSGLSIFYQAMKRGLDTLLSLPNADAERVAMTGLSGGGWQTILLSALDTRIKLAAPDAGYTGIAERARNISNVGDIEQAPPDFVATTDYAGLTALLAPRPALLLYNAQDDCCFGAALARAAVYEPVVGFYTLFNKDGDFVFHTNEDPGNHNYDRDNREQFYRFYNRHFLPESDWADSDISSDGEIKTLDELRVGVPAGNATFYSIADGLLAKRPGAAPADPRAGLRELLRFKPLQVDDAARVDERTATGVRIALYRLRVGPWTVPAAVIEPEGAPPVSTRIIFADRGKFRAQALVTDQWDAHARVVVIDPLLMGECNELRDRPHQYAMLIATIGERPLGIQVSQVLAVTDWVRNTYGAGPVSLAGQGWNAGIAALAAGALAPAPYEVVSAQGAPTSLKVVIQKRVRYEDVPALFCFGILEAFDVAQLRALCQAGAVEVSNSDDAPKTQDR
ncbi:MAG: acetylxylan esterase [Candidatus Hydrogenedentes bacterium]|nr:acetylxylan esterase [Candidatus Hydrogenedentota bacterium]